MNTHKLIAKTSLILLFFFVLTVKFTLGYAQDTTALKKQLTLAKTDTAKVNLFNQLCSLIEDSNPIQALKYAEEAHKLAKKVNYNDGIARALINMAALQMYLGEHEKALKSNQTLYQLCQSKGDKTGMVSSLSNISGIYQGTSKYTEAAKYSFKALNIAEQIKDSSLIAVCEINIATLFAQQRDFEKAIAYATKARMIFKKLNETSNEAKSLEVLGNCYAFNGKTEEAKPYYTAALKLYEQSGNEMGKAVMYTQMVDSYADDPLKQIEYLQKAQTIWNKIAPNHINAVANTGNFGYTLFQILKDEKKLKIVQDHLNLNKAQMLKDAANGFKKGIALSKQTGHADLVSMFSIEYAKLCEYTGDYKGALENFKLHYGIQDSLFSQENKNKIAALEAQLAFQKKEDQYKQQQALTKVKNQQIYLYGGLVIVLISSVLIYFLNRSRINQLRLKNQLQQREAEERTKELLHQYQLSESELKAIRSQMNPHFIFNVLNSIEAYVMDNEKRKASRLIQKFAALTRLILENSTKSLVTADKEWKALMLYTELEAMRYDDAFTYTFTVADDIQLKTFYLPPMLIQPLIENAILHGLIIAPEADAHLSVTLQTKEDRISITVEDNGIGLENKNIENAKNPVKEQSLGLASIKERIDMINKQQPGSQASFTIKSGADQQGTIAIICLPFFNREPELCDKT